LPTIKNCLRIFQLGATTTTLNQHQLEACHVENIFPSAGLKAKRGCDTVAGEDFYKMTLLIIVQKRELNVVVPPPSKHSSVLEIDIAGQDNFLNTCAFEYSKPGADTQASFLHRRILHTHKCGL
jgi:hypothetical protein